MKPAEIEKRSFELISEGLKGREYPEGVGDVVRRVIHASADFDYADNLYFSENVIEEAEEAFRKGATVVTDTNMALSGISQNALRSLGSGAVCYMNDEGVAAEAKERGVTRAVVSMEKASKLEGPLVFAIGNAPTALMRVHGLIVEGKVNPALVIGAPVGFVNVIESKEMFIGGREKTPCIIARGRKGGSGIAAAIVNAILYRMYEREGFR